MVRSPLPLKPLALVCLTLGFLALLIPGAEAAEEDYYKLLGVTREATQADIKRAFRRLSVKFVPT